MEPWYKVALPRKEVREGRSFNPDEFAIHLEQVIARTAPEDYSEPKQFFARTCFTRALREHAGMALRRLSGETTNTAPVMTLITQFGGGKTHKLFVVWPKTLLSTMRRKLAMSFAADCLKISEAKKSGKMCPRRMPIGALSVERNYHPNGRQWIRARQRPSPGNI